MFDVFFSLFALIFFFPVFVLLALAVRVDSAGPVFYRQIRVGRGGQLFRIFKFRSMVVNADKMGLYYTVPGDKRVTAVGHFLRKTSLDELPQFINVLLGHMSVVGPRPDVPAQKGLYSDADWLKRVSVRPGVTGLAQATLRSSASDAQRCLLDLEYIDKSNFWVDLKIIVRTVRMILKGSC
jgi:lipopolysaccharide/colanic/teichoic acid biosynthesis glycosyltransferase